MTDKTALERDKLKRFEPLGELSDERLDELISLAYIEKKGIGISLFREGEIDNQTLYLLSGDIQFTTSDGLISTVIKDTSDQSRFPLDDSQPRQSSCTAMTPVEVFRIDNSVLDYMMMWDQMAVSEMLEQKEKKSESPPPAKLNEAKPEQVDDSKVITRQEDTEEVIPATKVEVYVSDKSWIRKMQHIMAFKTMPPANIKQMLEIMEAVELEAGDPIVKQGDEGDYYYVLVEGKLPGQLSWQRWKQDKVLVKKH